MALTDGIISRWGMNNVLTDSVGSNDGSASGAVFTTSSKLGSHAISIDAVDDFVNVPDAANLDGFTVGFTALFWYKRVTTGNLAYILNKYKTTGDERSWQILFPESDEIKFVLSVNGQGGGANAQDVQTDDPYTDTTSWHMGIANWAANTPPELWIDDVFIAQTVTNADRATIHAGTADLYIGSNDSGASNLGASLDEITLWNRKLSTDEMTEHWNGGAGLEWPYITDNAPFFGANF